MYRARSFASALVATIVTAAALTGVVWYSAVLAARGTSQAILPTLLTTNNFAGLGWPFRADQPPISVHVAFYVAAGVIAIAAGVATMMACRNASPRNGASAFVGTWLGVVIGSVLAAGAVYYIRLDALASSAADQNGVLAELVRSFAFGGVLLGIVPAILSWATFKIANRTRAAEYTTAMDLADGKNVEENPFDLTPSSIGAARPVEPGFTYPAGDTFHDGSYRDADLSPSERRANGMTFSDVTDMTGEDFADTSSDVDQQQPVVPFESADEPRPAVDIDGDSRPVQQPEADDVNTRVADYGVNPAPEQGENDPLLRQTGS